MDAGFEFEQVIGAFSLDIRRCSGESKTATHRLFPLVFGHIERPALKARGNDVIGTQHFESIIFETKQEEQNILNGRTVGQNQVETSNHSFSHEFESE